MYWLDDKTYSSLSRCYKFKIFPYIYIYIYKIGQVTPGVTL